MAKIKKEKRAVGWKEHVGLPDLKIKSVIAKIDTGANVATIDAANIKFATKNNVKYVKFTVKKRNNTIRKTSNSRRSILSTTQTRNCRHSRVIPTINIFIINHLY